MPTKLEWMSLVCRIVKVFFTSAPVAGFPGKTAMAPATAEPIRISRRECDFLDIMLVIPCPQRLDRKCPRGFYSRGRPGQQFDRCCIGHVSCHLSPKAIDCVERTRREDGCAVSLSRVFQAHGATCRCERHLLRQPP